MPTKYIEHAATIPDYFGYQEPSGFYRRELSFTRALGAGTSRRIYGNIYNDIFLTATAFVIPPTSTYDYILRFSNHHVEDSFLQSTGNLLPYEFYIFGEAQTADITNTSTESLSVDMFRVLWYHYDDFQSRVKIAYDAPNPTHASLASGIVAAITGIQNLELINLYYHDWGPSGNFTRRVVVPLSSMGNRTVISGEEPVNTDVLRTLNDSFMDGLFRSFGNNSLQKQDNIWPFMQTPLIISERQRILNNHFLNVRYNERHVSFPHLNAHDWAVSLDNQVFISGYLGGGNSGFGSSSPYIHQFSGGTHTIGLSHTSSIYGGGGNTITSGLPCPAFPLDLSLKLNNLSLKPERWIKNTEYYGNSGEYLPGPNKLFTLEQAKQVGWGIEYLRNVCGILELPSCRPSGILALSVYNDPIGIPRKFKRITTLPEYSNPSYTGVLRLGNARTNTVDVIELGCEFVDPTLDVFRAEVNFSTTCPSSIDINWSCLEQSRSFTGVVKDRFGNSKNLQFRWQPILTTSVRNNIEVPPRYDIETALPDYFLAHQVPNYFVAESPCSGSLRIESELMNVNNSGVVFYDGFLRSQDLQGFQRLQSANYYADQESSPFYFYENISGWGPFATPRNLSLYTYTSMLFWELICESGSYSSSDVLVLETPEHLSLSSGNFSINIDGLEIPTTEYRGFTTYDKNRNRPDDYRVVYDYLDNRDMDGSYNQQLGESGFFGRWSSLAYKHRFMSTRNGSQEGLYFATGHEPMFSGEVSKTLLRGFPAKEHWYMGLSGIRNWTFTSSIYHSLKSSGTVPPGSSVCVYDTYGVNRFDIEIRNAKGEILYLENYNTMFDDINKNNVPGATGVDDFCKFINYSVAASSESGPLSVQSNPLMSFGQGELDPMGHYFKNWQFCEVVAIRPVLQRLKLNAVSHFNGGIPGSLCGGEPLLADMTATMEGMNLEFVVVHEYGDKEEGRYPLTISLPSLTIVGTGSSPEVPIAVGQTAKSWWPAS